MRKMNDSLLDVRTHGQPRASADPHATESLSHKEKKASTLLHFLSPPAQHSHGPTKPHKPQTAAHATHAPQARDATQATDNDPHRRIPFPSTYGW